MKDLLTRILLLFMIGAGSVICRIKTIKNFRSLKNSNINRLETNRKLQSVNFKANPLIYSVEKSNHSGYENNHHFLMLSHEIAQKENEIKKLNHYVDTVQSKVDSFSENVVDRINEVNNLVNNQLLDNDSI